MRRILLAAGLVVLALSGTVRAEISYLAKTIEVGGSCAEIGAWAPQQRLLIATAGDDEMIDLYHVAGLPGEPRIESLQRIDVEDTEPTSSAVHPSKPLAFVTALEDGGHEFPGQFFVVELSGEPGQASGKIVHRQSLPPGPDCIAIAPDGSVALVAIEAEEDPTTPGRILAIDLAELDKRLGKGELPVVEIPGLAEAIGVPVGRIEPEFIAISPDSKLAAVSCQENDAIVLIDLSKRAISGVIRLTACADPDGVAVTGPIDLAGQAGYLVLAAEEGRKNHRTNVRGGQCMSIHFVPAGNYAAAQPLCRYDVRKPLLLSKGKRCDPEGVVAFELAGRRLAVLGLERRQQALLIDITEPTRPRKVHVIDVGVRPEGLFVIPVSPARACCVVVNEGNGTNGSLTFVDIRDKQKETAHAKGPDEKN